MDFEALGGLCTGEEVWGGGLGVQSCGFASSVEEALGLPVS